MKFYLESPTKHKPHRTLWLIDSEENRTLIADMIGAGTSHKHEHLAEEITRVLNENIDSFDENHLETLHI